MYWFYRVYFEVLICGIVYFQFFCMFYLQEEKFIKSGISKGTVGVL